MEKINFVNNTTPALNSTNLNKLQQNIEDEANLKLDKTSVKTSMTTSDSDTYSCNYINLFSEIGKSIRIYRNSNYNIQNNTRETIQFNAVDYNTSSQLSKSGSSILIGENVHTVLVIAQWTAWESNGETRAAYILKNSLEQSVTFIKYNTVCATSSVIPVQEGDLISFQGYQNSGSTKSIEGANAYTYLQVIVLN